MENTLFLGKHFCKVDRKFSWKVPSVFKRNMKGNLYLIQGFERNLLCLTEDAFHEIFEKISSNNIADPLARLLLRLFLGSAHIVRVTKDGFIQIPEPLYQFLGSKENVCIIGQGDYFEIWAPDVWKLQEDRLFDFEQNATRFSSLDISLR